MAGSENVTSKEKTETKSHKTYTVLGQRVGGGPHGVGDPEDKTLRKVEQDVLIMEKVRLKSRTEKCGDLVKEFSECSKEAGLLLSFKCRAQNMKLHECLSHWYNDEELREKCKQEYLRERSEFRRTGIPVRKYNRGRHANQQPNSPEKL